MAEGAPGKLEVITGCMFSGKTEELIRRVERARIAGQKVLLYKPSLDNRYAENSVVTHYGREFQSHVLPSGKENYTSLSETTKERELKEADMIAFDEGNFFSENLVNLTRVLIEKGKRVLIAGLDLTFAGDPFPPIPELMARSDRLDKLHAVCIKCGRKATRTQRLIDGKPAPADDKVIKVGGIGDYEARCRDCWELGED